MKRQPTGSLFVSDNGGQAPRGYYLVKGDARYFISEHVNPTALEKVAGKVLSDAAGWDYWVDYCMGLDVSGRLAWANIDKTDLFL